MPQAPVTPGWFGKLPALGDFASRRLPTAFVHGWDDWLQRGLEAAVEAEGEGWLDRYLRSPPRRFWLAPELLARRAWAGVLVPSVDRVGRRFALTIAAPAASLDPVPVGNAWYDAVEHAALHVFVDGFGVDDLERELAAAGLPPDDGIVPAPRGCSLWWRAADAASPLRFDALPEPAAFATLFADGGVR